MTDIVEQLRAYPCPRTSREAANLIEALRAQLAQAGVALEDIAQWGDAAMAFGSTAVDMRATARGVLAKMRTE